MVALCLVTIVANQQAQAQALPVANLVVNRAVAGVVTRVAAARGFAANDPRIAATLTGMGEVSTALNVVSTGASVGLAFAGAPVWLTIAAGVGVLAAGATLYASGVSLSRSLDGKTITGQQPVPELPAYDGPLYQPAPPVTGSMQRPFDYGAALGMQVYRTDQCMVSDSSCVGYPALPSSGLNFVRNFGSLALVAATLTAVQSFELYEQQYNCKGGRVDGSVGANLCVGVESVAIWFEPNANGNSHTLTERRTWYQLDDTLENTLTRTVTLPVTWWSVGPGAAPVVGTDLSSVYEKLSAASLSRPLDPPVVMQLVNQLWQRAAQVPGYQGLPYSLMQPVTYSEVQEWMQANPDAVPRLGHLFEPATGFGTVTVVISPTVQPGTNPNPNPDPGTGTGTGANVNVVNTPNVNVVNKVQVDLGTAPTVATPGLEATPTARSILDPVLNLMPDLKAFTTPHHQGECPRPSVEVFDWKLTFDSHCQLAEETRQTLYQVMMACWALAAVMIILMA